VTPAVVSADQRPIPSPYAMPESTSRGGETERPYHHSVFPRSGSPPNGCCRSPPPPARDEAATIGAILENLMPLLARGVIDQVVVVDDSTDATADIARSLGAEVHAQSGLHACLGPVLGKGDAMWRGGRAGVSARTPPAPVRASS
jgi:hypothetical protein